jgi:flagellar protein FlaJ
MVQTYVSIALFATTATFLAGLLIFIVFLIFNLSNIIYFWIPFLLAGLVLVGFYVYPASQKGSLQKKISSELPFVTIHMAAIIGSNIEPTKIFRIISESKEYKFIGGEMRKILNQIEIYGYDVVTALKNVSKITPSDKLAELYGGLATNIATGGDLKNYLESKAENYLSDYKLERKRYSEIAGTFMDIYISILIAAPLVLMMVFIIMGVSGLSLGGLSLDFLFMISIGLVGIVNIIFLIVLNFKQPSM